MEILEEALRTVQKNLIRKFGDNLKALILYGSWAKGTARGDSDIDLLALFEKPGKDAEGQARDIARIASAEKHVTIVPASLDDFRKEKMPLYTAVKREGKIISGSADLSMAPGSPEVKYAEFFKTSYECESGKIRLAEELLVSGRRSGIAELCFIASKHAIQAGLAMHGEGYSSKVSVLLPLARGRFGREIAEAFEKIFDLYLKSEYSTQTFLPEDAQAAAGYARKILQVYRFRQP
jgi:predicted nucleotidyltransferase